MSSTRRVNGSSSPDHLADGGGRGVTKGTGHIIDACDGRAFGVYTGLIMGCLWEELKGGIRVICRAKSMGKEGNKGRAGELWPAGRETVGSGSRLRPQLCVRVCVCAGDALSWKGPWPHGRCSDG